MDKPVQFSNCSGAAERSAFFRPRWPFAFGLGSFLPARWAVVFPVALALVTGFSAGAQNVQHLTTTQPGGMPGLPVMGGIEL